MNKDFLKDYISVWLQEDSGTGDHTSLACISSHETGFAELIVKQDGVIAGIDIAETIFNQIDKSIVFEKIICDGEKVSSGVRVFNVNGSVRSILKAERLVLNVMQRMSGIATKTRQYCNLLIPLKTKILDTRKTTPGFRYFEKEAVRLGGGYNHRMGLYDMIMIKDNHIDFAGSIEKAIHLAKEYLENNNLNLKIEVESRTFNDIKKIMMVGGIDRIMFDNFSVHDTEEAIRLVNGKYETESSGCINLSNIRQYAETGVDFISVGALTHQINSLDLSLKAKF
jgi:nicotinate-nucleotide pyrophosphorylase (carboxylating)